MALFQRGSDEVDPTEETIEEFENNHRWSRVSIPNHTEIEAVFKEKYSYLGGKLANTCYVAVLDGGETAYTVPKDGECHCEECERPTRAHERVTKCERLAFMEKVHEQQQN